MTSSESDFLSLLSNRFIPTFGTGRIESGGTNATKLMPLRPVCVLIGNLEMGPNTVLQIM